MLGTGGKSDAQQITLEPVEMEAGAIDSGRRHISYVLPPVGRVPKHKTQFGHIKVAIEGFLTELVGLQHTYELRKLLSVYDRYRDSVTYLTKVCALLQLAGDTDRAEEFALEASRISNDPLFLFRVGELKLENGKPDQAKNIFMRLGKEGFVDAKLRLAELYVNNNDIESAQIAIKDSIEDEVIDWRVRMLAGTLYLARGKYELAIRQYRVALEDKPNSSVIYTNLAIAYYLLGLTEKAMGEARKAIGVNPWSEKALSLYADIAIENNKHLDHAEHYLKHYIEFLPLNDRLVGRLADIYYKTDQMKKGIALLESVKSELNASDIWNNLGVFNSKKNSKFAIKFYYKAIEIAGGVANSHSNHGASIAVLNLANALQQGGFYKQSEKIAKEFIESAPNMKFMEDRHLCRVPVYLQRAYAYQDKLNDSNEIERFILSYTNAHPIARLDIFSAKTTYFCYVTGEYERALVTASEAYKLSKSVDDISLADRNTSINNLAFVLIELGRLDEAKKLLPQLRYDCEHSEFGYATRGLYEFRVGHLESGKKYYHLAMNATAEKNRKDVIEQKLDYELGRYWLEMDDMSRSRKFFKKVISMKNLRNIWKAEFVPNEAKRLLNQISARSPHLE